VLWKWLVGPWKLPTTSWSLMSSAQAKVVAESMTDINTCTALFSSSRRSTATNCCNLFEVRSTCRITFNNDGILFTSYYKAETTFRLIILPTQLGQFVSSAIWNAFLSQGPSYTKPTETLSFPRALLTLNLLKRFPFPGPFLHWTYWKESK
jgi:hypothetical protein